jgi:hypothetical protein
MSLLQCEWPSFIPIQNNRKNYIPVYLYLIFFYSKLEGKRFCTEFYNY